MNELIEIYNDFLVDATSLLEAINIVQGQGPSLLEIIVGLQEAGRLLGFHRNRDQAPPQQESTNRTHVVSKFLDPIRNAIASIFESHNQVRNEENPLFAPVEKIQDHAPKIMDYIGEAIPSLLEFISFKEQSASLLDAVNHRQNRANSHLESLSRFRAPPQEAPTNRTQVQEPVLSELMQQIQRSIEDSFRSYNLFRNEAIQPLESICDIQFDPHLSEVVSRYRAQASQEESTNPVEHQSTFRRDTSNRNPPSQGRTKKRTRKDYGTSSRELRPPKKPRRD